MEKPSCDALPPPGRIIRGRGRPWPPSRHNHGRRSRLAVLTPPVTASLSQNQAFKRMGEQPASVHPVRL